MLNKVFVAIIITLTLTFTASAEMLLFVGEDCSHCQELEQELSLLEFPDITIYEIYYNSENAALYLQKSQETGYTNGGVPLLIDGQTAIEGKVNILNYLLNDIPPQSTTLTAEESAEFLDNYQTQAKRRRFPSFLLLLILVLTGSAIGIFSSRA